MTMLILRALHLQAWVVFVVVYSLYIIVAGAEVINGYTREVTGWRHPGRPSRMHKVIWHWHTGLHVGNQKTYDDKRTLKLTSGWNRGSTPEGLIVIWHPWKRWHRAVRNNLIIIVWLSSTAGMVIDPASTVQGITVLLTLLLMAWVAVKYVNLRRRIAQRSPSHKPALSYTRKAREVFRLDATTVDAKPVLVEEQKPQLEGVPQAVIASLLAGEMGCSSAEVVSHLKMSADRGELILPDSFAAKSKQREGVEEVIKAHTKGSIRIEWNTTETPRNVEWVPIIIPKLPSLARFRDYLDQIEALPPREFGVGLTAAGNMYTATHNGDAGPWHCRFAGPGTGKSTGFLVKAAQIAHRDPYADIYCVDSKQVSFEYIKGIPGIHVFDNPQSEMDKMWNVFYTLAGLMDDRYTAVREKRARYDDFNDIWLLVDEGNDLGAQLKSYSKNVLGNTTAGAPIWGEAIARLIRMGRQCHIYGEWMFQDLDGRLFAGETLKSAFSVYGAAGFSSGQFARTIGSPAEECIDGVGKILMCRGNKREWVQGFYDDEEWLHDYALENRKELAL